MKTYNFTKLSQGVLVAILLFFGLVLGFFGIIQEYRNHSETIRRMEEDYVQLRKAEVRAIVDQLAAEIEFHQAEVVEHLKASIVDKVRMAMGMAAAILERETGRRGTEEIKQLIIDALMPLRFFNGWGYYWIHDTNHTLIAHPFRKASVGADDGQTLDSAGQPIIREFVRTAQADPEGGFVSYYWSKPEVDERLHRELGRLKIAYVQLFEPLNWVIGVGEYVDQVEAQAQESMRRRIAAVRYGEAGYIFNHTREGVCLNHINAEEIGKNRWELLDAAGLKVVQALDRTGRQPGGGFLEYYASVDPRTGQPARKLSFVRSVDGWGWVLGGGVYVEDLEARLAALRGEMAQQLKSNVLVIALALALATTLVLLVVKRLMGWFSRELSMLVANDAKKLERNDLEQFKIAELREIAEKANVVLAQRAQIQAQLLQAQKMESIGILAGGVAHDFNNLLQAVGGNVEFLLKDRPEGDPDALRLRSIGKAVDRAAQLVRQLLVFGRKAGSRRILVDLNQEVQETLRILERTVPKMIKLEQQLDPDARMICADPIQIEQILLNLTSNAVDAMPDGGTLAMETRSVNVDEQFARNHPGAALGPHLLLTVSDTGCGMDKEVREHLFDPFFTTKEVGKGTGLGLATVYGIVKSHGGHIQCHSEPGTGTVFKILFPTVQDVEIRDEQLPPVASSPGGDETILVVEDEAEIRELTKEALETLGYVVKCAVSGEEALQIFQEPEAGIDLVLMDLNMPGMGGRKCLQALIRIDPAARVIIVSGYADGSHGSEALSCGAKAFIGKPFQLEELGRTVRRVLDQAETGEVRPDVKPNATS